MTGKKTKPHVLPLLRRGLWGLRIRRERLLASLRFRFAKLFSRKPESTVIDGQAPLPGRFCPNPFKQIDLEESGVAFTCCSSWLPTPMGNIKHAPLEQMWNGQAMQKIRESIFDGSFRYCRHDRCPMIQNDSLPTLDEAREDPLFTKVIDERQTTLKHLPQFVNLVNDRSCNLYCPSCRTERINHTEGAVYEETAELQARLLEPYFSESNDRHFVLSITGSGDPFASRVYRDLLYNLDGSKYPNMKIALQTNGVLLTPRNWERMKGVHDNIASIIFSFDAASEETYAVTRRGGHWPTLVHNARRMGELRARGLYPLLRFDFVVQKENYREMPAFVELSRELGADRAYFSRLIDWGTWPKDRFMDQCVWEPQHPEYEDFAAVITDPLFDQPFVDLGNMTDLRNIAKQHLVHLH
ncbi:MAG: radical SAM protein [Xanthomonadales bacterium]|nr:radical SAM protein [Xanthomonadales bacterium]